jgi:transcriptional regulator NrdR family protein
MDTKFIKRNGSVELYDENKIIRVLIAAGLNANQAENLAKGITSWIKKTNELQINSLQIRNKVIEELEKTNKYVANFFQWYEKNKDQNPGK